MSFHSVVFIVLYLYRSDHEKKIEKCGGESFYSIPVTELPFFNRIYFLYRTATMHFDYDLGCNFISQLVKNYIFSKRFFNIGVKYLEIV